MLLDHVEIAGFRGINRLSLNVNELNAFLGENRWGKSSLFDALSLFLSGSRKRYKLKRDDFYISPDHLSKSATLIQLVFTFKEHQRGEALLYQYKHLSDIWCGNNTGYRFVYYLIEGEITATGNVVTNRFFLDAQGAKKNIDKEKLLTLINEFVSFVPVLRMGQQNNFLATNASLFDDVSSKRAYFETKIKKIFNRLNASSQQLSKADLAKGYEALSYIFDHYLFKHYDAFDYYNIDFEHDIYSQQAFSFDGITHFSDVLKKGNKKDRAMLLMILGEFLEVRGEHLLRKGASPILLIEELESNLHPVNLAITWRFFSLLPMQKLVSTNSSLLLSFFPLSRIQRLVRQSDVIKSYQLDVGQFSKNDLRRIAFHIRMNRPHSLFARAWLMVEGETETWLLNELARICGYNLTIEGIQIIEFAQCGLSPLIKIAQNLNIEWHVLTDGDAAGQKYADRVEVILRKGDLLGNRLTVLPAYDIEHLFFESGFRDVYVKASNYQAKDAQRLSTHKIISKAVQKHSKPWLGLTLAEAVEEKGVDAIPLLLKRLFARMVGLARSQSG